MRKSLRWKLLAWYLGLIALMACIFSALTVLTIRHELEQDAVQGLSEKAISLSRVIEYEEDGQFSVDLSHQQLESFAAEYPAGPYYRIWDSQRRVVDCSSPAIPSDYPPQTGTRWVSDQVEVIIDGPAQSRILVGHAFETEQAQIRRLILTCVGVATVTILVMLAGGWWMIGQMLKPIDRISAAAARVTESNISERIRTEKMESEFLLLSNTFNGTLDRLEDAFRRQNHFTADASHELRTPLSILLAQCEHVLNAERTPAEYRQAIETIQHAATRMKSLVESLLILARADAEQAAMKSECYWLDQVVQRACEFVEPLAQPKDISIVKKLERTRVKGDPEWFAKAVINLLTNAINYNRDQGTVTVSVCQDARDARLIVCDSGIGISEDNLGRIFDRFFRVDPARPFRSVGGTGLGLPITQWIVESQGGKIAVESCLEKGTTFTITLPRSA
ncbi:sensor histidine kinase [Novipirellula aureliae]|uniref:sensor histidine kinase n=1 Tax=Novipirellula aureliae TaxID=2527966 RepID=UPI0018CF1E3C